MKRIGLFLCGVCISWVLPGQVVSPVVPDFTDITAPWVTATTGNYSNPFQQTGVVPGRHTVISVPGTDGNTGGKLSLLPPGESRVVRLGNELINREAESISYRFVVDVKKSVLLLKFAVVMEDPAHAQHAQPRFVVRILDKDGYLVESCAQYDVHAGPDIAGFQSAPFSYRRIQWRDWTAVGLDLSPLAGQEVQVQFLTYDCDYRGHFGYAYFTAACVPNRLVVSECTAQEVTLKAPDGFASYTWQDGSTGPSRTVPTGAGDVSLACEVVSATGCRFTLSALLSSGPGLPARDTVLYDTVCEGDEYHAWYYHLPAQNTPGTAAYYNTFFNPATCSGDVLSTLFLTTVQRYFPIEANICEGEDYTEHGFRILQPAPGVYTEKTTVRTGTACEQVRELRLVVALSPERLQNIAGNSAPCEGSVERYEVPGVSGSGNYRWEVPATARILTGQGVGKIRVQYTDAAGGAGTIAFTAENGCGQNTVTLPVMVYPSYYELFTDSLCAGDAYSGNGFQAPPQPNGSARRTLTQAYKTAAGCDSIRFLELKVFDTPVVEIRSQDSVVCPGDEVSLTARVDGGSGDGVPERRIHIGDVVCTDNSVLPPVEFLVSGKTAKGVVCYVDPSGIGGTMVALHQTDTLFFPTVIHGVDVLSHLPNHPDLPTAVNDLDGPANTALLRAHATPEQCPAVYAVDVDAGWYIPALGELRHLSAVAWQVNIALHLIGGDPLGVTRSNYRYYSSTRIDFQMGAQDMHSEISSAYTAMSVVRPLRAMAPFPDAPAPCAGVRINRVCWATSNVDAPGIFAARPEDVGLFYQWNRKKGWSGADPLIAHDGGTTWDSSVPSGDVWEAVNDPCPDGWRVPAQSDFDSLLSSEFVTLERTTQLGVEGGKFTDKLSGASIFFPVAGYRTDFDGSLSHANSRGYCWSGLSYPSGFALSLVFTGISAGYITRLKSSGLPVRCVQKP